MRQSQTLISKIFSEAFGSQLRRNMSSGSISMLASTLVLIVSFRLYLHFLGYEQYGLWLVLATVLSFAQLGDLGVGQAVMKLVAEEYVYGNTKGIQQYVTTAIVLLCFSGLVVFIVLFFLKNQIVSIFGLSGDNAQIALWLLPYVAALSVYVFIVQVLNSTLAGLGRMDLSNYILLASRIVAVSIAIILLNKGRGIESLLIGNTISYLFMHLLSLIFIKRMGCYRFMKIGNITIRHFKRLLRFGGGVFGGTLVGMFVSPFNKLMLSQYVGLSVIPIYEIAFNGSMQLRGLIEPAFRALMPEISRLNVNINLEGVRRIKTITRHAGKLIIVFAVPVYVSVFCLATPIFKIWLGKEFVQTIPFAFRVILVGTFISLMAVPSYYFLMGLGHVRDIFIMRSITALTNVVLVIIIALNTDYLSVIALGFCLIIAWFLSTSYIVLRFRCEMAKMRKSIGNGNKIM